MLTEKTFKLNFDKNDIFLVHGQPFSGKSHTIRKYLKQNSLNYYEVNKGNISYLLGKIEANNFSFRITPILLIDNIEIIGQKLNILLWMIKNKLKIKTILITHTDVARHLIKYFSEKKVQLIQFKKMVRSSGNIKNIYAGTDINIYEIIEKYAQEFGKEHNGANMIIYLSSIESINKAIEHLKKSGIRGQYYKRITGNPSGEILFTINNILEPKNLNVSMVIDEGRIINTINIPNVGDYEVVVPISRAKSDKRKSILYRSRFQKTKYIFLSDKKTFKSLPSILDSSLIKNLSKFSWGILYLLSYEGDKIRKEIFSTGNIDFAINIPPYILLNSKNELIKYKFINSFFQLTSRGELLAPFAPFTRNMFILSKVGIKKEFNILLLNLLILSEMRHKKLFNQKIDFSSIYKIIKAFPNDIMPFKLFQRYGKICMRQQIPLDINYSDIKDIENLFQTEIPVSIFSRISEKKHIKSSEKLIILDKKNIFVEESYEEIETLSILNGNAYLNVL